MRLIPPYIFSWIKAFILELLSYYRTSIYLCPLAVESETSLRLVQLCLVLWRRHQEAQVVQWAAGSRTVETKSPVIQPANVFARASSKRRLWPVWLHRTYRTCAHPHLEFKFHLILDSHVSVVVPYTIIDALKLIKNRWHIKSTILCCVALG